MTPTQLEHLRLIDAHLAALLELAAKRTPGEWYESQHRTAVYGRHNRSEQIAYIGMPNNDAAFIASCAGNAEAGWQSTKAAIKVLMMIHNYGMTPKDEPRIMLESILAEWPIEKLKLP